MSHSNLKGNHEDYEAKLPLHPVPAFFSSGCEQTSSQLLNVSIRTEYESSSFCTIFGMIFFWLPDAGFCYSERCIEMSRRFARMLRPCVCAASCLALAYGMYSTWTRIRASVLAGSFTLSAVGQALTIAPGNSEYWVRHAQLLDIAGLSGDADLHRAAELNPYEAAIWIRLGLDREVRGDYAHAEQFLLRAARVSRLYQPRWTLANFYFRRGVRSEFWRWTRQALQLQPQDPVPLYQLCWAISDNPVKIREKAIPDNAPAVASYAAFLLAENRIEAAAELLRNSRRYLAANAPLLFLACDRFIESERIDDALEAWNATVTSARLDPRTGASLTNGAFLVPATGSGFDWRPQQALGVSFAIGSGAAAVFFDGREPENCEPLVQLVPVVGGRKYRLHFEYKTSGITPRDGLSWRVSAWPPGAKILGTSGFLSSDEWTPETFDFDAPRDARVVRLALTYNRAAGQTRIDGSILTRAMRLL